MEYSLGVGVYQRTNRIDAQTFCIWKEISVFSKFQTGRSVYKVCLWEVKMDTQFAWFRNKRGIYMSIEIRRMTKEESM